MTMLTILKILATALFAAAGSVTLKVFADTDSLYIFTLSLSLYMAGTVIMADLMRGGLPLGLMILVTSVLQLVLVQIVGVLAFGEPFRAGPVLMALVAVALLLQPTTKA